MKIGIVGGGIAGLTTAYELACLGHEITLFEKEEQAGGLARSFDFCGDHIEKYYHFICRADDFLADFLGRLGLGEKLCWKEAGTGYFVDGSLYPFSTPADLLGFAPVSLVSKARIGLNMLVSKHIKNWRALDRVSAKDWLIKNIGEQAYNVIWDPLLRIKFGRYYDRISAAWIWHRIYRLSRSRKGLMGSQVLGFINGGSKLLVDTLLEKIKEKGGKVHTGVRVRSITQSAGMAKGIDAGDGIMEFDRIVSAVPVPVLKELLSGPEEYLAELGRIKYIGVICMILKLKKPLTENFWVNINDKTIAINGLVEYSNLNPYKKFGGSSILYIPYYLDAGHERCDYSDEKLLREYSGYLKQVNPAFSGEWIEDFRVFRDTHAQPICHNDFLNIIPGHNAPVGNLFIIDASQMYPTDRTLNDAIRLARDVAVMVAKG